MRVVIHAGCSIGQNGLEAALRWCSIYLGFDREAAVENGPDLPLIASL